MKIYTQENVSTLRDDKENLIRNIRNVLPVLYPDKGKAIRNKKTGFTTDNYVVVGSKDSIDNYEEVEEA